MSWDTMYDDLEKSQCACGNGTVTRYHYSKMDDWNRTRSGYHDEKIQCINCASKYHIEHHVQHHFSLPWKGDGISDTTYLIPNGMTLKHDISEKKFGFNLEECIVSSYKKDSLVKIIDDMMRSKYSTRLGLADSNEIVSLYYCKYKKRSLPNIVNLLKQCVFDYSSYEWDFDKMQEYKRQEKKRIEVNTRKIDDTISQSHKLDFQIEQDI